MPKTPSIKNNKSSKKITTIKLSESTKLRLEKLRVYERETYDEILRRMLDLLTLTRIDPDKAESTLISIERKRKQNLRKKD